jgi:hypothetical protein
MRVRAACLGAVLAALSALLPDSARAMMVITDDIGGRIGKYVEAYQSARQSGEMVVIDGVCLSACTLVLGIVPKDRICITRRATLGFHAAWLPGPEGRPVRSEAGTQALWEYYPPNVRKWIRSRGGLSSKMLFLRGRELTRMYPECRVTGARQQTQRRDTYQNSYDYSGNARLAPQ